MGNRAIQAVIFDMDGTLVDSEPNYRAVDQGFLASHGISFTDSEWQHVVGMGGMPFVDYLKSNHGLSGDPELFIAEKDDLYLDYARGRTNLFPATRVLLDYLRVQGVPVALATSSRTRTLRFILEETGLTDAFPVALGSDDVRHSKPAPDLFVEAARRLGVKPGNCLVLEDSPYGVQAARSAGMTVVGLPEGDGDDLDADLVVPGGPGKLNPGDLIRSFGLCREGHSDQTDVDALAARFQRVIANHDTANRRDLPWRGTGNPYHVLVSEFMLQQTQVKRVIPRYRAFVDTFPDIQALASAKLSDVLTLWQGLGYNRRARNLHETAMTIVGEFNGMIPQSEENLRSLPGVGEYTAAAIRSFGFDLPATVVDTNIRRVVLHFFYPCSEGVSDKLVKTALQRLGPTGRSREWSTALMDYGALLSGVPGNANRRSAHYSAQSTFAGSIRQMRGRIVRVLTDHGALSLTELEHALGPTDQRLEPALSGLEKDRMIERVGGQIRIPE